jgi:hypothetical protein
VLLLFGVVTVRITPDLLFCNYRNKFTLLHDVPLWSPNSQQVIVNKNVDTGSIFIDLPQKAAYKIQELPNTTILGWMNSLP